MKYYFAPVQGHTDAAYRHFHVEEYGRNGIIYTTPFIRLEKGEIRKKDLKEISSILNDNHEIIPQIIFRDKEELYKLVAALKDEGVNHIDINMGCPFPLQTSKGRGAATIGRVECHEAVTNVICENPEITFSVKMRLGNNQIEWEKLIETLNSVNVDHITVHPRLASDQYTGPLNMEEFEKIYQKSKNKIVYNGDILSPADARIILENYPSLNGIMIGRGALARPSIFSEIMDGKDMDKDLRIRKMKEFHRMLFTHYHQNLIGGDHQVLSKIQPFWEYAEDEIGRKGWKALKKASNMAKYQTAMSQL